MVRAFISGCSGQDLTPEEFAFFRDSDPWGLILFRRNVGSPEQVLRLTSAFREAVGRAGAPVLVDQEGGRVQRLAPPNWQAYPSARRLGSFYANDPLVRREVVRLNARLIAHDLRRVGISVNCLPVLDVPVPGAHDVIGDRAFAANADEIAILGRAAAEGLLAGCVMPVMKHIPGHGRAGADSHLALPIVEASLEDLRDQDFRPFQLLADLPAAMSAHVVYTAVDPTAPGTTSRKVIRSVVRGEIGFGGLLISDDLSMKALSGTLPERATASLRAGCDLALHCSGVMEEMREIAAVVPLLAGMARRRAEEAPARIAHGEEPFDPVEARQRLDTALAAVA
jgi:beta-N-acetylhexosaminidase